MISWWLNKYTHTQICEGNIQKNIHYDITMIILGWQEIFFLSLFIHIFWFSMISIKKGGLASSIPRKTRPNRTSKLKKKRLKKKKRWNSLAVSGEDSALPLQETQAGSPVGGLSFHKPHSQPHGVGAPTAPPWPQAGFLRWTIPYLLSPLRPCPQNDLGGNCCISAKMQLSVCVEAGIFLLCSLCY